MINIHIYESIVTIWSAALTKGYLVIYVAIRLARELRAHIETKMQIIKISKIQIPIFSSFIHLLFTIYGYQYLRFSIFLEKSL